MITRERWINSRRVVLGELTKFAHFAKGGLYTRLSGIDEVTSGLMESMSSKKIPTWLAIGMQIYFDIYHSLRINGPSPFHELLATGKCVSNIIASRKAFSMDMSTPLGWPMVSEKLLETAGANWKQLLIDNYLSKLVGAAREAGGQPNAKQKHVLLSRHCILCGRHYILCGTLLEDSLKRLILSHGNGAAASLLVSDQINR